jgi:hypothetical protein
MTTNRQNYRRNQPMYDLIAARPDLTNREIADMVGVKPNTVETARRRLGLPSPKPPRKEYARDRVKPVTPPEAPKPTNAPPVPFTHEDAGYQARVRALQVAIYEARDEGRKRQLRRLLHVVVARERGAL